MKKHKKTPTDSMKSVGSYKKEFLYEKTYSDSFYHTASLTSTPTSKTWITGWQE